MRGLNRNANGGINGMTDMKILIAGLFAALSAGTAFAEPIETGRIIAAITGDWNMDGGLDLAVLTRGESDLDLHFFLQKDGKYLSNAGVARGKLWGDAGPDAFAGIGPEIKALPNGSILVTTRNETIGRDRWNQTLTLAYRNTDFIVAGFTYSYRDTLDLNNSGDCDLNVLTGKGIANEADGKGGHIKRQISVDAQFIPLKDWLRDGGTKACGLDR